MSNNEFAPLATRMRPRKLAEYVGQAHLLSPGKPLYQAVQRGHLHSMILWGPPGTGKTTLAEIMAAEAGAEVERLSAVLAGVKEIREVVSRAKQRLSEDRKTILFVDEVHRFNKSQQDAFLPHVEQGVITLIGATTENPSFQLNNALLSRARVYILKQLDKKDLLRIVEHALTDKERGLGDRRLSIDMSLREKIVNAADGDARQCLGMLELLADFATEVDGKFVIEPQAIDEVLAQGVRRFDHHGDVFYDQISALHKSVRGSNPDAALYWLSRMLEAGCDPNYVARRVVRMASEDVGNADPRALRLALDAWETYDRVGSPEGEIALAQAVIYCACAPKSNAVYKAFNAAWQDAKQRGSLDVPMHLRNAPTQLMKRLDFGKDYRYAHNEAEGYAAGENYFPDELRNARYYHPVHRGLEIQIKEKLDRLRALDEKERV